jgi:hypothetical protein
MSEAVNVSATVNPDLTIEARRMLDAFAERGLQARLLGGLAIRLALGERYPEQLKREHEDIDLICAKRQSAKVEQTITELGWQPRREFNALNGARRLLFEDPPTGHKVDAFVETFEMCHKLPLAKRLEVREDTLSPADLLLTKLQIVELNVKDRADAYALLSGFPLTEGGDGANAIDVGWIAELTARDWGLHHTLELNLERLRAGLGEVEFEQAERERITAAIDGIEGAMERAPKSRGWKLRARIGERKRWYEVPEEVG